MPEIVNAHAARTHLPRLRGKAHAGEEIVLGKAGTPDARLVPLKPVRKRKLGFPKGKLDDGFFDPSPDAELDAWAGK